MTAGGGGGKRCQRARRAAPRAEVDDGAGVGDGLKRPTGTLRDAQAAASDEDGERLVDPGEAVLLCGETCGLCACLYTPRFHVCNAI